MSINLMFNNVNKEINNKKYVNVMFILRDIWLKYPQNSRIFEEIKKLKKKITIFTNSSLDQNKVNSFFTLHKSGKTLLVINPIFNLILID